MTMMEISVAVRIFSPAHTMMEESWKEENTEENGADFPLGGENNR